MDNIDGAGLVKVATFVKEGIAYLADRPEPMTNTIASSQGPPPAAGGHPAAARPAASGRRVSFGTVPDFAFSGPGVKVASVVPGSPAEKAGVKEGDVLLKFAGKDVENLRGYSGILKELEPGQTVTVVLDRSGEPQTLEATLTER